MTPRELVLTTLDFGSIDRVPRTIIWAEDWLKRRFLPTKLEEHFRFDVCVLRPETAPQDDLPQELDELSRRIRVGDYDQLKTYAEWGYYPGVYETNPLDHADTLDEIARAEFPCVADPSGSAAFKKRVSDFKRRGIATLVEPPHLGGEIFEAAWRLRGFENLMRDLILNPQLSHFLFARLANRMLPYVEEVAASEADMLLLDDDIGTPSGMLISPDQWRCFLKPHLSRFIRAARHVSPSIRILYHSDGDFEPIIGDLIEIGVDAIHPVQPDVMNPKRIRKTHGRKIAILGAFGAMTTFSFESPGTIRREARQLANTLGRKGGLILAPAYDLEEDVPIENIEAFFQGVDSVTF